MGLFDKIFKKQNHIKGDTTFETLTAYQPVFSSYNGQLYESLQVRAAIDARARHISKLRVEVVGTANKKLKTKLSKAPNSWQTWPQFLYRASTILDCTNTCCIVPVLDENMDTIGYFPVLPTNCKVVEYHNEPWLKYQFANGNTGAIEYSKCIVLTKFQYNDDFFGSDNSPLNETMSLIHLNNQGIEEAVRSSATFRFMAQMSNFSNAVDLAKERRRFTRENLMDEEGGLLLFPNTYKDIKQIESKPYTVNAEEMKIINTNVYNYFGVNEDILQNKAFGDAWSAFYEGAIEAFAVQFSEGMTKCIYTEIQQATGNYVMATSNRLQYLSNRDKLQVASQMADRGVMTRNEIREMFNLTPLPGGDVPTIRGEYYLLYGELQESGEYKILHQKMAEEEKEREAENNPDDKGDDDEEQSRI